MKFLWQSNASWAGTGYGAQTRLILPALRELGHEPICFAFYGLQGGPVRYDGYLVLPNAFETWGNDVILAHTEEFEVDAVVTLMDLFVLREDVWSRLKMPWIAWTPIDCEGIGEEVVKRLHIVDYPVAMSGFGAEQMQESGIEPKAVIYHAVDTDVFQPMDKWECRRGLGIDEDEYIIGMVMANKSDRKQYPVQLSAIRRWMDEHEDRRVRIFVHTDTTTSIGGWDFKELLRKVGLTGRVYATNQYRAQIMPVEPEQMAKIYNSMDVLMNVSSGEGFGIPIVEAQACGVPVISGAYTSMPEITRYGYTVKASSRGLAGHYGWQFIPDVEDMVYRLESAYRMANKQDALLGRQWVVNNCSLPVIAAQWDELLGAVEPKSEPKVVVVSGNGHVPDHVSKARRAMASEAKEYGEFENRMPEYEAVVKNMQKLGLQNEQLILDLGAGYGDLGRYLMQVKGWYGAYVPVDMVIDGTDLSSYDPPSGFDFLVLEQVIEHLTNWPELLDKCEATGAHVVVATPNGEVTMNEKYDYEGQMAHVAWITPEDLERRGYITELHSFTGRVNDTIVAYYPAKDRVVIG